MATKKKNKKQTKKQTRKTTAKKQKPAKKLVPRKATPKKKAAKKRVAKKAGNKKSPPDNMVPFMRERARPHSGGQSGDLQGLSNLERADSESVDELLEEGNTFEAEAVAGVENAGNADEEEVHTHEVSEDDVPSEYLDKE
jgi:hypothetical protein